MNVLIRKAPTSTALKQAERRRGGEAETRPSIQEHGRYQWAKSNPAITNGTDATEYRDLVDPTIPPPRHTPWGDSTRLHAVSAVVWLRSNSQPGQGLHLGMDQACIDRGSTFNSCAVKGQDADRSQTQHSQKKNWPCCPNARASLLPLDQHVDVPILTSSGSASSSHQSFQLLVSSPRWRFLPSSPPIHRFSLSFSASTVDTNSRRFASLCRAATTDSIFHCRPVVCRL